MPDDKSPADRIIALAAEVNALRLCLATVMAIVLSKEAEPEREMKRLFEAISALLDRVEDEMPGSPALDRYRAEQRDHLAGFFQLVRSSLRKDG